MFLPFRASYYTTSVVEAKTSGLPHVLKLWLGVSKGMLPVTMAGGKQGHTPCNCGWGYARACHM